MIIIYCPSGGKVITFSAGEGLYISRRGNQFVIQTIRSGVPVALYDVQEDAKQALCDFVCFVEMKYNGNVLVYDRF